MELRPRVLSLAGVASVLAVVSLPSCHDDCPENTDHCPACPSVASSCPDGCDGLVASPLDTEAKCFRAYEVIACWPHHTVEVDWLEGDLRCVVRLSDGALFNLAHNDPHSPGWRPCTDDEMKKLASVSACTGAFPPLRGADGG
jgi:hypothetical protein